MSLDSQYFMREAKPHCSNCLSYLVAGVVGYKGISMRRCNISISSLEGMKVFLGSTAVGGGGGGWMMLFDILFLSPSGWRRWRVDDAF